MKEILLNQLFAGAYLQEGTNIGHEVINLFKDDNDENYLFITPSGKVHNHDVDKVLFVQNIKSRKTMEVIMKAEGITKTLEEESHKIFYGGENIVDIFRKNRFHEETESTGIGSMTTYRANEVRFPKKKIIITVDQNYVDNNAKVIYLGDKDRIVGQGMRTYLSQESYVEIYKEVKALIEDESLWEKDNSTQKMFQEGSQARTGISFLEIIRKENDELIMSNLLAYYFNYNHSMFVKFAEEVLKINCFEPSFEIIRESKGNIDLWIHSEHCILVIENKIKSGINGKTDDGKNQLNKYYEYTENYRVKHKIDKAYYFLFVPDYNDISIKEEKFRVIHYSEIYEFFRKHAAEYMNDKYFSDFLFGLKNHTMTFSEWRFSIMRSRFLEKINQR